MEDELTEILVQCKQGELVTGAPGENILVLRAGAEFGGPGHLKALFPQGTNGRTGEVLISKKLHAVVRG